MFCCLLSILICLFYQTLKTPKEGNKDQLSELMDSKAITNTDSNVTDVLDKERLKSIV